MSASSQQGLFRSSFDRGIMLSFVSRRRLKDACSVTVSTWLSELLKFGTLLCFQRYTTKAGSFYTWTNLKLHSDGRLSSGRKTNGGNWKSSIGLLRIPGSPAGPNNNIVRVKIRIGDAQQAISIRAIGIGLSGCRLSLSHDWRPLRSNLVENTMNLEDQVVKYTPQDFWTAQCYLTSSDAPLIGQKYSSCMRLDHVYLLLLFTRCTDPKF